jgi:hypothetical protein
LGKESESLSKIIAEWPNFIIERVSQEQLITIDYEAIAKAKFSGDAEIKIKWSTNEILESIQVEFSNKDSDFKNDLYKLKTFKPGDTAFQYVASPLYEVLDYGDNTYLITAKWADRESITKIVLKIDAPAPTESTENEDITNVSPEWELGDLVFPKGKFWDVRVHDGDTIFYSDIKGLEIKQKWGLDAVVCEAPQSVAASGSGETTEATETQHSLTRFLLDTYSTWLYWNTCRPTVQGKGVSFYAVRLAGDNSYVYEKHYLDYSNELHGILELESGTWVTKDNIWEKNTELKAQEFEIDSISDDLFKEIIKENRS